MMRVQRDRQVVASLAALLGNASSRSSESICPSDSGVHIMEYEVRRSASDYLR